VYVSNQTEWGDNDEKRGMIRRWTEKRKSLTVERLVVGCIPADVKKEKQNTLEVPTF